MLAVFFLNGVVSKTSMNQLGEKDIYETCIEPRIEGDL